MAMLTEELGETIPVMIRILMKALRMLLKMTSTQEEIMASDGNGLANKFAAKKERKSNKNKHKMKKKAKTREEVRPT